MEIGFREMMESYRDEPSWTSDDTFDLLQDLGKGGLYEDTIIINKVCGRIMMESYPIIAKKIPTDYVQDVVQDVAISIVKELYKFALNSKSVYTGARRRYLEFFCKCRIADFWRKYSGLNKKKDNKENNEKDAAKEAMEDFIATGELPSRRREMPVEEIDLYESKKNSMEDIYPVEKNCEEVEYGEAVATVFNAVFEINYKDTETGIAMFYKSLNKIVKRSKMEKYDLSALSGRTYFSIRSRMRRDLENTIKKRLSDKVIQRVFSKLDIRLRELDGDGNYYGNNIYVYKGIQSTEERCFRKRTKLRKLSEIDEKLGKAYNLVCSPYTRTDKHKDNDFNDGLHKGH